MGDCKTLPLWSARTMGIPDFPQSQKRSPKDVQPGSKRDTFACHPRWNSTSPLSLQSPKQASRHWEGTFHHPIHRRRRRCRRRPSTPLRKPLRRPPSHTSIRPHHRKSHRCRCRRHNLLHNRPVHPILRPSNCKTARQGQNNRSRKCHRVHCTLRNRQIRRCTHPRHRKCHLRRGPPHSCHRPRWRKGQSCMPVHLCIPAHPRQTRTIRRRKGLARRN